MEQLLLRLNLPYEKVKQWFSNQRRLQEQNFYGVMVLHRWKSSTAEHSKRMTIEYNYKPNGLLVRIILLSI